ncbi:hypothetical protein FRC10_000812 [Ceratobasidium sp. 414]|nr:hypothetical protein FRC10_000812 [Ceratobasidium sp. 414]
MHSLTSVTQMHEQLAGCSIEYVARAIEFVMRADFSTTQSSRHCSLRFPLRKLNHIDGPCVSADIYDTDLPRFVLVSITDLKPDYTQSSAQTLLVISQMLSAQANPQNASLIAPSPLDTPSFSPSSTALLVNSLWMLSLALSVAVSLIAMLAKDWCYKFMSSRSGPAYEQARRRQRKWNGIEKWGMNEVLTYLPGMLHLALLLFAIGLCLYLWDINVTVAIPVVVVTGSATLIYIMATILPYIDHSCPYSTPASGVFTAINNLTTFLRVVLTPVIIPVVQFTPKATGFIDLMIEKSERFLVLFEIPLICGCGWPPVIPFAIVVIIVVFVPLLAPYLVLRLLWASIALVKVSRKLFKQLAGFLHKIVLDAELDAYDGKEKALMDYLTSQMLAWLISNCEDSRSVDTTLQAIAGADHNLPHQPLNDSGILGLVSTRLDAYVELDNKSKKYTVKDPSQFLIVLRYCRTYIILTFGDIHQANKDGRSAYYEKDTGITDRPGLRRVHSIYTDLLEQAEGKGFDSDVIATAASVAMPFSEWQSQLDRPSLAPETAFSILAKHLQSDCTLLSTSSLVTLMEFVPHYLLWAWSRENQDNLQHPQHLLPILLAQIFIKHHSTELEIARTSATALVTAAFAANDYYGGETPLKDPSDRKRRAAQVLQHYQTNPPDSETVLPLFIFGFYQLLPHLKFDLITEHLPGLLDYLDKVLQADFPRFNLMDTGIRLHNIPSGYSLEQYALQPALGYLASFIEDTSNDAHQIAAAFWFSPLLIHIPGSAYYEDPRIYGPALITLCRTNHTVLQNLLMNIIDEQPIPTDPEVLISASNAEKGAGANAAKDAGNLLGQLCGALMANETPALHVAILHFELLVARIVSSTGWLKDRQSALRPLLSSHSRFAGLKGSSPLSLEDLFSYLEKGIKGERCTRDSMPDMMQYVADFCAHGVGPDKKPEEASGDGTKGTKQEKVDWYAKLVELKNAYKPSAAKVERPNPRDAGSPSPSNRGGLADQEAGTPLHGITQAQ